MVDRSLILLHRFCFWMILITFPRLSYADPAIQQEFLQMVPGGKVDLDLIVEIAYRYSDAAQILKAELDYKDQALLEATAQNRLERSLSNELVFINDRFEAISPFNPDTSRTIRFQSRFVQQMDSGTSIDASLTLLNTSQDLSEQARIFGFRESFAQGEAALTLRQSLWSNRLGQATRKELEAAKLSPQAIDLQYQSELGRWFLDLSEIYYQAWLAQRNVEANEERLRTQKRLLQITRLSLRRGTAEQADILNIESQVLLAERSLADAVKQLQDIWRQLLVALKLPEKFFQVDPQEVPLVKKDQSPEWQRLCSASAGQTNPAENNPQLAALNTAIERLRLQADAGADRLKPDLYGLLGVSTNSYGSSLEASFGETARLEHPRLTAGLGISMNLDQAQERAGLSALQRQLKLLELEQTMLRDQLRVQWLNQCQEVERLQQAIQTQRQIIKMSQRRQKLEEERFQLGRVEILNVISASNDLITARQSLERSEQQLSLVLWQLKNIRGEIAPYVVKVADRNLLKGR
ncbi:MAG: TolC family protein [Oligoflexus sp.]